jgi:hypothetical protein
MKILLSAIAGCLSLTTAVHGSVTLTLDPSSNAISGIAGSTIGWGFALTDPADYAVITSSNFCLDGSGASSACVPPTLGIYTDYIASNFIIAGPPPESPVVSQVFNSSAMMGVGSFTVNASAPALATDTGQIVGYLRFV